MNLIFPVILKKLTPMAAVIFALAASSMAQIERCPYIVNPAHREPISDHLKERMIELCIADNKREFEKLLERTEELARLTDEIETSFNENNSLSDKDRKKLDEAEDLVSKIRKELKADDDDNEDQKKKPRNVVEAIILLKENTTRLVDEIKKTSRHSISVVAIQSSTTVLKLVKWLRFNR